MTEHEEKRLPDIHWTEGLLDYFNIARPPGRDEYDNPGFSIGRQIVGLHLVELLLKYALQDRGPEFEATHNLKQLFDSLPPSQQRAVERKYKQLLQHEVRETWDIARTVKRFLNYLGRNPITETRYVWEPLRDSPKSILITPTNLRMLIYALYIALHDYPEGSPLEKRYRTRFISLEESMREQPN